VDDFLNFASLEGKGSSGRLSQFRQLGRERIKWTTFSISPAWKGKDQVDDFLNFASFFLIFGFGLFLSGSKAARTSIGRSATLAASCTCLVSC